MGLFWLLILRPGRYVQNDLATFLITPLQLARSLRYPFLDLEHLYASSHLLWCACFSELFKFTAPYIRNVQIGNMRNHKEFELKK